MTIPNHCDRHGLSLPCSRCLLMRRRLTELVEGGFVRNGEKHTSHGAPEMTRWPVLEQRRLI